MTMPTVADVEQAIIGRLSSELPYVRTLGSISEFLERDLNTIEELAPLCPALFIVYARGKYSQNMSGCQDREMIFGVIAAVRNLRGDSAVRHGAAGEKGIYQVLEDVRAALSGESCGIEMEPLAPISEEAVAGGRDFALYQILFKSRCRFNA